MASKIGIFVFGAAMLFGTMAANAIPVAIGGTGSTGTGGFTLASGNLIVDVNHPSYYQGATTPASNWVWDTGPNAAEDIEVEFQFSFDMTGYSTLSASLDGFWGVDNEGEVFLNGVSLSLLEYPEQDTFPFNVLHAFSAGPAAFESGINILSFVLFDRGTPGAFRASFTVDAAPGLGAEVPVPAALPLFGTGLAVMGFLGWRRKRKSA